MLCILRQSDALPPFFDRHGVKANRAMRCSPWQRLLAGVGLLVEVAAVPCIT